MSHESLADFLFRLRTLLVIPSLRPSLIFRKMCLSLTFFWQPAQVRRWFFFQVAPVADFFQVEPVADFIASSHDSVADIFFSLRRSLTFFTGRARCFFLIHVARIAGFFPGRARPWFFPRLRKSQIFFSGSHKSVADFFRLQTSLGFSQVAPVADFSRFCLEWLFASSHESVADFLFRLRSWLAFSQFAHVAYFYSRSQDSVADFIFRLRRRWLFSKVAPVADFSPGCACRWLFCRLAWVRRWFFFSR